MLSESIQVSVGVIINNDGKVLLAKRPETVHQGGLWEFPGGKQEQGENSILALQRELLEELGLNVLKARPFIKLHYTYPDKSVVLDVWLIKEWSGTPFGREGQFIEWMELSRLPELEFPPANRMIIKAIQLPPLYLISPGPQGDLDEFFAGIDECTRAGAKLLQLRCNQEIYNKHTELVSQVLSICETNNARLLLNSSPATAVALKAHGVHLNSARLLQLNERPLDKRFWVSASCHNQNELLHATKLGIDFIVLSPVNKTPSHPDAVPLGWEQFSNLTELANVPIYALGGMSPEHLDKAWNYGAQGVAMLSNVWSSNRPGEIVRECLR